MEKPNMTIQAREDMNKLLIFHWVTYLSATKRPKSEHFYKWNSTNPQLFFLKVGGKHAKCQSASPVSAILINIEEFKIVLGSG